MKYSTKLMVVPYTNKPFDNDEAYMHKLDISMSEKSDSKSQNSEFFS